MIDRTLNYGRHHIARFTKGAAPFERVLDIGAGPGADLMLARLACPSAELWAVEVHPPSRAKLRKLGVNVVALDLEKDALPFADNSVDVIIANQILEHVKEVFWIFHEISRVLRPGGHLILGVPNLASLHNRVLLGMGRQPSCVKNSSAHVRGWTKHDMLRFLETCFPGGYRLDGFGGGNFYPLPGWMARPLSQMLPNCSWAVFMDFVKEVDYVDSFLRWPVDQQLETNFFVGPSEALIPIAVVLGIASDTGLSDLDPFVL